MDHAVYLQNNKTKKGFPKLEKPSIWYLGGDLNPHGLLH